ncbi:MAG: hypothetical protein ABSC54_09510 [Smithellaceae bacterium]
MDTKIFKTYIMKEILKISSKRNIPAGEYFNTTFTFDSRDSMDYMSQILSQSIDAIEKTPDKYKRPKNIEFYVDETYKNMEVGISLHFLVGAKNKFYAAILLRVKEKDNEIDIDIDIDIDEIMKELLHQIGDNRLCPHCNKTFTPQDYTKDRALNLYNKLKVKMAFKE